MVFQQVGLSWIIKSNQKINFDIQLQCPSWVINGPQYNSMIFLRLNGSLFEDSVTTEKCDRYNIICSIDDCERNHKSVNDEACSGGGRPLQFNST